MKTRIIVRLAIVAAILFSITALTSCQSKEEKVIAQLESLCKTVEKDTFSAKDADSVQEKYDAINEAAQKCEFTSEQLKEVARLKARFTKAMAKKAIERIGSVFDGVLEGLSGDEE